jgi:hypothetical protein
LLDVWALTRKTQYIPVRILKYIIIFFILTGKQEWILVHYLNSPRTLFYKNKNDKMCPKGTSILARHKMSSGGTCPLHVNLLLLRNKIVSFYISLPIKSLLRHKIQYFYNFCEIVSSLYQQLSHFCKISIAV